MPGKRTTKGSGRTGTGMNVVRAAYARESRVGLPPIFKNAKFKPTREIQKVIKGQELPKRSRIF